MPQTCNLDMNGGTKMALDIPNAHGILLGVPKCLTLLKNFELLIMEVLELDLTA